MQLVHAVATTYTLDLDAALSVPLAFASRRLQDPDDQISVMEALRQGADRIDIFCQAGAIRAPVTKSPLYAFLEPMIHPVDQPGRLFHPKIWLASYASADATETAMRLLVLTRNLTADRSWDVALRLDGVAGVSRSGSRGAVGDLISWALDHTIAGGPAAARQRHIRALVAEAGRTEWEKPDSVLSMQFEAFGVGRRRQLTFGGSRQLIISPFLTPDGLSAFPSRRRFVVSRQEELDRLPAELASRLDARVINEDASLDDDGVVGVLSGLHAKTFVTEFDHRAWVTVGSANATHQGLERNVEFVVTLEGLRRTFGIDAWLSDGGLGRMLLPYSRAEAVVPDEVLEQLEGTLRQVGAVPFTVTVSQQDDACQQEVAATADLKVPVGTRLTVGLVTTPGQAYELGPHASDTVTFDRLRAIDITPFLVLTASAGRQSATTLIRATMINDVPDRLDQILTAQVDTADKFLRWLLLLLDDSADLVGVTSEGKAGSTGGWWQVAQQRGLFEALVGGLADRPAQLDDVGRFVLRVRSTSQGQAVLPAGFDDLWRVVYDASRMLARDAAR